MFEDTSRKVRTALTTHVLRTLAQAQQGKPQHYVQVGANDGVLADPIFETAGEFDWSGLLIEPHPDYFKRLSETHRDNPKMTLANVAISDQPGTLPLYSLAKDQEHRYNENAPGCASMDKELMRAALVKTILSGKVLDTDIELNEVPLRRLEDVLADNKVEQTDVLVVDVEGFEPHVLRSFKFENLRPKVALIETKFHSRTDRREIFEMLSAANYKTYRFRDDLLALSPEFPQIDYGTLVEFFGFKNLSA